MDRLLLLSLHVVGVSAFILGNLTKVDYHNTCTARGGCSCDCSWAQAKDGCNHDDKSCCWGCCCLNTLYCPDKDDWNLGSAIWEDNGWTCESTRSAAHIHAYALTFCPSIRPSVRPSVICLAMCGWARHTSCWYAALSSGGGRSVTRQDLLRPPRRLCGV
jgi:hypothetical protein